MEHKSPVRQSPFKRRNRQEIYKFAYHFIRKFRRNLNFNYFGDECNLCSGVFFNGKVNLYELIMPLLQDESISGNLLKTTANRKQIFDAEIEHGPMSLEAPTSRHNTNIYRIKLFSKTQTTLLYITASALKKYLIYLIQIFDD